MDSKKIGSQRFGQVKVKELIAESYFRLDLPAQFNIHLVIHIINELTLAEQPDDISVPVTRVHEPLEGQWSMARYPQESRKPAPLIASTVALVKYIQILARSLNFEVVFRE